MVASSAIRKDNPELAEARRRGLRVLHRSVALGTPDAGPARDRGGRHSRQDHDHGDDRPGADRCGFDPSYVIGGALTGSATGGHLGAGEPMVVEADESDGWFLQYPAEVAVVTNVDPDHLSNWGTAEHYADGFLRFATAPGVRLLVVSADDPGAVALTARVRERIASRASGSWRSSPSATRQRRRPDHRCQPRRDGFAVRVGAGRRRRAGGAGGARVVQRAECRSGVRGGPLARCRRERRAARAVGVPGDVPAVPADRRGRRRPGLRRLRAPSDRGPQHPGRCPHRGRPRPGRGLLPATSLHPDPRLLAGTGGRAGAGGRGGRDGCLR